MIYISNKEQLESTENVLVESRLFNISRLVPHGKEIRGCDFAKDVNFFVNRGYEQFDDVVISIEETDHNYYEMFIVGKRLETDEEKETRLSNLILRQEYVDAINKDIQEKILKPINILDLPPYSIRQEESAIYWFNSQGIGLFKVKFANRKELDVFSMRLHKAHEIFDPTTSIYTIHKVIAK